MTGTAAARPSLPLRIAQVPLVRLVVLGASLYLLLGVSNGFRVTFADTPGIALVVTAGMVALALAVYAGFVRFVERRPVTELSTGGMGRELGAGMAIGAGLYTLCVLILMALGHYRIVGLEPWQAMLPALVMALSSGFFEELVYRGTLFRILEETFGSWIAVVASSLVFGVVHLRNPQGTLLGALAISIEAGLLLAAAFMVTRRLWLSIGYHMAWNFTQAGIFSGVVSGTVLAPGLFVPRIEGPALLTGGAFGLEASVIAVALCTVCGAVMLAMAVRRGHSVPPPWRRAG